LVTAYKISGRQLKIEFVAYYSTVEKVVQNLI